LSLNYFEISQKFGGSLPIIILGFGFIYAVAAGGISLPESWESFQWECARKKIRPDYVSFAIKEVVPRLLQWFGLMGGMLGGGLAGKLIYKPVVGLLGGVLGYLLLAGMLFIPGILLGFLLPIAWEKLLNFCNPSPDKND